MGWTTTHEPDAFLAAAGAFLRAQPARHTVLITVPESLRRRGPNAYGDDAPLLGWWEAGDGAVRAAFLHTPPFPLLLSDAPDGALAALADELARIGRRPQAVNGTPATATSFARAWCEHAPGDLTPTLRSRLYRLAELTPPQPPPPGGARVATAADRDVLIAFYEGFMRDTDVPLAPAQRFVDERLGHDGLVLWIDDAGEPVAMAGATRKVADMVRVAPVYTPPEQRRRGYGGAVTAAISERALADGAREVVIFADLDNPTTPTLYPSIGYERVEDHVILKFAS